MPEKKIDLTQYNNDGHALASLGDKFKDLEINLSSEKDQKDQSEKQKTAEHDSAGSEAIPQGLINQAEKVSGHFFDKERREQACENIKGDKSLLEDKIGEFKQELIVQLAGLAHKNMLDLNNLDEVLATTRELFKNKPKMDRKLLDALLKAPEKKVEKFTPEQEREIISNYLIGKLKKIDSELSEVSIEDLKVLVEDDVKVIHNEMPESCNGDDIKGFVQGHLENKKNSVINIINKVRSLLDMPEFGTNDMNSREATAENEREINEEVEFLPKELIKLFGVEKGFEDYLGSSGGDEKRRKEVVSRVRRKLTEILSGNGFEFDELNKSIKKVVDNEKTKLGSFLRKHFKKVDEEMLYGVDVPKIPDETTIPAGNLNSLDKKMPVNKLEMCQGQLKNFKDDLK